MLTARTGFPGKTVEDPVKIGQVVPKYMAVNQLPIAATEYKTIVEPVPAGAEQADAQYDVFLEYSDGDTRELKTYQMVALPAVHGMSGGGYFDWGKFSQDSLWSLESVKLYGIQSSWCERKVNPYVRGTQIVYWLKLIAENYPDLKDALVDQFPRINNITL